LTEQKQRRVLVTGAAGMLGSQVLLSVPDGTTAVGTDLREAAGVEAPGVDLGDARQVRQLFEEHGPFSGVIHTAAYTAVDKAEEEVDLARYVNVSATRVLAEAAAAVGIPFLLVSTDFVFDGSQAVPYREDDATGPLSVYGSTKLEAERAAFAAHPGGTLVVRTQWLYGPRGKHFPGTMRQLAQEREEIRVVNDQHGAPTSTLELAPALWDVLERGAPGVYHAACEGQATWFDLAQATLAATGHERVRLVPCTSQEFPRPARRPAYSVLDCSRLTELRGKPLATWREALSTYLGSEDR
jgi:dTDP-4-dehydrorhamnose reductase